MYERYLEPPVDYWEEYGKPLFIENLIKDMCKNIQKHIEIYDMIYEYIEDNIEKYMPERSYDE